MTFLLTTMLPRCWSAALVLVCVLTVTDAAAQTITLSLSPASLTEDAGSADIAVTATLSATRTSATTVTLSLAGMAVGGAGKDYTTPQNPLPTITIPANATTGNTTLIVSLVDDTFWEGDEIITVNGSAGGLTVTGTTLTLTDDEERPELVLSPDRFPVGRSLQEDGGTSSQVMRVLLRGSATLAYDLSLTISVDEENSAAEQGTDFTFSPSMVTIPSGERSVDVTLNVTVVDDAVAEPNEGAALFCRAQDHQGMELKSNTTRFYIIDDDRIEMFFSTDPNWILEDAEPTEITITATTSTAYPSDITVTLTPQIWEGDAMGDTDEILLTVPGGVGTRTATGTITVTPIQDTEDVNRGLTFKEEADANMRVIIRPVIRLLDAGSTVRIRRISFGFRQGHPGRDPYLSLEGDGVRLAVSFNRDFKTTIAPHLSVILDNGNTRNAVCGARRTYFGSFNCIYTVLAGDIDLDGVSIGPMAFSFNGGTLTDDFDTGRTFTGDETIPSSELGTYSRAKVLGWSGEVSLLPSRESLQEGVGSTELTVEATLTVGPAPMQNVTIPLVFTDITTTGSDYTVDGPQEIVISAGSGNGRTTLTFTPVEDYVKESRNEIVQIAGGMSEYFVVGTELEIIDAPSIVLSVDDMSITEDGGAQQVVVTAALGDATDLVLPRPIPVTLSLFGSAGGGDYTIAEPLIVTIPANTRLASKTLTFTPVNDLLLEGDETIVLRGTTPGLTVEGTDLVLEDDDMDPQVVLILDDNTIAENDGETQVMVTVELDPSVIVNNNTVVTLNLMGSAILGSNGDYTAMWSPQDRKITVPALSAVGAAAVTLTLTPEQDMVAEGDETIEVEGMAVVENTGEERIVRVVTITLKDDDLPSVVIDPTALAVPEAGSSTYTVVLTTEPTANVTVRMTTEALSATDISVDRTVLTFTPDNWNQAQEMTVRAGEDEDARTDETVTLTHTVSGGGYDDVVVDDVIVTITENDAPVLSIVNVSLEEDATNMTFTVEMDRASGNLVAVHYMTSDGTATAGDDYTAVPLTKLDFTTAFFGGFTSQTFTVPILEDDLDEGDETFTVTLSAPINATLSGGGTTLNATGTIIDDDRTPIVTLTPATQSVAEDAGSMDFTVSLDAESSKEITVDYATSDGTATAGKDYNAVSLITLTFAAGETEKTFTVTIKEDDIDEDNETFIVRLSAPVNAAFAGDVSAIEATGTITDNDDTPSLSIEDVSLQEENANMTFTVTLSAASGKTVTVNYATSDGTASEPADYGETSEPLTFDPGETEKTFTVTIKEDDIDEAEEETFTVTLSGASNATIGDATATGTIQDDDDPRVEVSFDLATYTVDEGSAVTVTVRLSKDPERTVAIQIEKTHEGGATPADYSGVPGSLTFDPGETEKTITFTATDDTADDDGESVVLRFRNLPDRVSAPGTATATVAITDDDDPQVTVSFHQSSYVVSERAGTRVEIHLSVDPERTVVIPIETTYQGGATADDHQPVPESRTFNAGERVKFFFFTGQDDKIDEDNEKVVLSFGTLTDDRVTKGNSATVTIVDDDTRGVTVVPQKLNVPEGESNTYTVVLTSEPTADVTVTVGGASGDVTVTGSPLTFTSSNWNEAQTVTVTTVDDNSVIRMRM